jgi:hypothetical protein
MIYIGGVQMSQKSAKSAAELESMIMAELREHPECESAGVAVKPTGVAWDAVLIRAVPQRPVGNTVRADSRAVRRVQFPNKA